jgi:uncharacterized membrane protein
MRRTTIMRATVLVMLIVLVSACATESPPGQDSPPEAGTQAGVPAAFYTFVTWVVVGLEAAGIASILAGVLIGLYNFFKGIFSRRKDADKLYGQLRERLGRAILLGLEFLVAADIVNTVAVDPTFHNLGVLAIVVIIRTFLSFAIEAEIHGRWPWQHQGLTKGGVEVKKENGP